MTANYDEDWGPDEVGDLAFAPSRSAGREPKVTFAVRLERADVDRLKRAAQDVGIGPTQLVRQWILERLEGGATTSAAVLFDDPRFAEGLRALLERAAHGWPDPPPRRRTSP